MDIKWIEDFLSLVKTRSFSRSAEERHVSQSAFSRRIQSLEAWVGVDLIDRSVYPLNLTVAGKHFHDSAEKLVQSLDHIKNTRAFLRGQNRVGNMVQVAAGHTLSLNFFTEWLKSVQENCGEVNTVVLSFDILDAILALNEGSCDVLLSYYHPEIPIGLDSENYQYIHLGDEYILPVSVSKAGKPVFALPGTHSRPVLALGYGSVYFNRVVDLVLSKLSMPYYLKYCHQSNLTDLLKKMVLEGYGVAWLPERLVQSELADGRLMRAGGEEWSITLEIRMYRSVHNKKASLNHLWNSFSQGDKKNNKHNKNSKTKD